MNIPLRNDELYTQGKACQHQVTMHFVVHSIKKLWAFRVGLPIPVTLWLGMSNWIITDQFRPPGGTSGGKKSKPV